MRTLMTITGNLARQPEVRVNKDGSRGVRIVVADQDTFKSKGNFLTRYYEITDFLSATKAGNGAYDLINVGDLISVSFDVRPTSYVKDGNTVYTTELVADRIQILEAPAIRNARKANKIAEATATATAVAEAGAEVAPTTGTAGEAVAAGAEVPQATGAVDEAENVPDYAA